jgi:hypothetical protein
LECGKGLPLWHFVFSEKKTKTPKRQSLAALQKGQDTGKKGKGLHQILFPFSLILFGPLRFSQWFPKMEERMRPKPRRVLAPVA